MTRASLRGSPSTRGLLLRQELEQRDLAPELVPCDGCPHAITCRSRQLACKSFAEYVKTGRWKPRATPRLPSRRPYLKLFRH
jgi:hypothetical protein